MKRRIGSMAALALAAGLVVGCVSAKLPEKINIGTVSPREDIDSSDVPETENHEQARAELYKAYRHIRDLERDNSRLRRERDRYKDKYDELKDKYDD